MRIGPAETERVDAGEQPFVGRQRGGFGHHAQVEILEIDAWVGLLKMQVGGNHAVPEGQQHLHQSRHPGGRFQMAEVALDRAHGQGAVRRAALAQDITDGPRFDRVTNRRTRAVRFEEVQFRRVDFGLRVDLLQKVGLGLSARNRDAIGLAIAVHAAGFDYGENAVTIFQGLVEKLEHDHPAPFGAHVAIRFGIERAASPVPREHARLGKRNKSDRMKVQTDATDNGRVALAETHGVVSLVNRYERRRTCRVDGQTWSTEVEEIRDTIGRDASGVAGGGLRIDRRKIIGHAVDVVETRNSNEDPAVGALEFGGF